MNELLIGIYLSFMPRDQRDGWWRQRHFSNHENNYSAAVSILYRFDHSQIIVADLGRFSQFLAFTRDDANYNRDSESGCNGDCLPTTWGYNYQSAQLAAYLKDRGWFRFGAGIKRTTWTHVRHESEDGDYVKSFSYKFTQTEYSVAPVLGVAYPAGGWRIVGQWVGDMYRVRSGDYICCPPSRDSFQIGFEK